MGPSKTTPAFWLVPLVLGILTSCGGLATKDHPPLVYALNLSPGPVSLELAKGDAVLMAVPTLGPLETKALTRVEVADGVVLRQGLGGATPTKVWTDPAGASYTLRFQTGQSYAIVVDPTGQAAVYSVPETYSSDPKLCIVNVTSTNLSQVQVAAAWAKNVKVYAQDVVPVVPSEFHSLEPKVLSLYWQTAGQVLEGANTPAVGFDGLPLKMNFETGRYYLFLAGNGAIRDLTPNLD